MLQFPKSYLEEQEKKQPLTAQQTLDESMRFIRENEEKRPELALVLMLKLMEAFNGGRYFI